jgi:hypothetical protein
VTEPRTPKPEAVAPREPVPEEIGPAAEYLVSEFEQRFIRRARIVRYGAVRFALEGEDVGRLDQPREVSEPRWSSEVVAVARPSHVRVIAREGAFQFLVWIPRGDLATVTTGPTTAALEPGAAPPAGTGVTLEAGFAVGQTQGTVARVEYDDGLIEFAGWVPREELDQVYEPAPAREDVEPDTMLRPGAAILAAPGGAEVARVGDGYELAVRRVGAERAGHVLVEYHDRAFSVRGYVPLEAVTESPPERTTMGIGGGGMGWGGGHTVPIELPARTCLYWDGVDEPIGVVTEQTKDRGTRGADGAWYVRSPTDWGVLGFAIRPRGNPGAEVPTDWERC